MGSVGRNFRLLGHPVHAPLTHFPLALWTAAFGADLVFLVRQDPFWWRSAFWAIALGLGIGSLTLLTGLLDYAAVPEERKETLKTASWHMGVMLVATGLFTVSLYYHRLPLPSSPVEQMAALAFSGLGTLCLHVGGWLGGQLVYHHGIGYDGRDQD